MLGLNAGLLVFNEIYTEAESLILNVRLQLFRGQVL